VGAAARLAELGVATTLEAAGGAGLLRGAWTRVVPGSRAAGPVRTALCGPADNLAAHRLFASLRPGDVVVLTRAEPDDVAFIGELMAVQAKAQGAAALLVDGAVRDVDELVALGFPVWARSVSAAGPGKEHAGALDVPVTVGGVEVAPGDLLVLDADGVVAVPPSRLDEVLAAAEERFAKEQALLPRLVAGELTLDLMGYGRATDIALTEETP
jgi:4-hydroxy-4-methyl-2-oxoglutarate aldolase